MKKTSVRDLHLKTSAIINEVVRGRIYVVERRGVPVAELRPFQMAPAKRRLPDREALIGRLPRDLTDSGRILEEDRS